ncbi:MAG TPA: GNAT family N-acetyltransferase [Actinophytocola sp.]|uniref:GNAT family N-acetyltransferase n=1 Tax=Actinophytocola sp. TaxID=1872138 RepID=UPI002DDD9F65|nr:GNAT family N-acetyltransferase [Actinophytocola sp.]HEV2780140.1 GNAT family N-acetyltransferase [Actinophytocola sp.]
MAEVVLRAARADEAGVLSELALRSKAHWGYDAEFLAACRAELTLSPAEVAAGRVVVAEVDGTVAGFYTVDGAPPDGELGNLWVDPRAIGTGLGRRLWRHAVGTARAAGFTALRIEADPHAEGFYLAMGARRVGQSRSASIPGRRLPLLRFTVS